MTCRLTKGRQLRKTADRQPLLVNEPRHIVGFSVFQTAPESGTSCAVRALHFFSRPCNATRNGTATYGLSSRLFPASVGRLPPLRWTTGGRFARSLSARCCCLDDAMNGMAARSRESGRNGLRIRQRRGACRRTRRIWLHLGRLEVVASMKTEGEASRGGRPLSGRQMLPYNG